MSGMTVNYLANISNENTLIRYSSNTLTRLIRGGRLAGLIKRYNGILRLHIQTLPTSFKTLEFKFELNTVTNIEIVRLSVRQQT